MKLACGKFSRFYFQIKRLFSRLTRRDLIMAASNPAACLGNMDDQRECSPEIAEIPPLKVPRSIRRKPFVIIDDISYELAQGSEEERNETRELFPIPLICTSGPKMLPKFQYIKTIETLPNYQRVPPECNCKDGCDIGCVCMEDPFGTNHAEIAYDEHGRIDASRMPEDWPDKNPVIWECSDACACGSQCPNRCAQNGLKFKLEVFWTHNKKGWGVRSAHLIPKGSFITEYAGVMKVAKEGDEDEITENNWYSFEIATDDGYTNFFIDATQKGNVSRFFNHSCNPNMFAVHVYYDDKNPLTGMHIGFYAKRDIQEGEELTFDYGPGYWAGKRSSKMGCECGERGCKYKLKTSVKRKATTKDRDPIKEFKALSRIPPH